MPPKVYDSSRRPHPFFEEAWDLVRYNDLLLLWTRRNITLRYKRSVLGVLWTLVEPLLLMAIMTLVFSTAFRFALPRYPVYILSGLLLFDFFSRSTTMMMEEIVNTQSLAQRFYLPRSAFAVAALFSFAFNWLVALLPLTAIMLLMGQGLTWSLLTLPLGLALAALFALGVGLTVTSVAAFFPDAKLMYGVVLSAWFYATPIIYPEEVIAERWLPFFELSPLFHLVRLVRYPAYYGQVAPGRAWLFATLASVGAALIGWWLFTRRKDAYNYDV